MSQLTDLFTGIANAIRAKSGSSETIQAANFATTIAALPALKTGTFTPTVDFPTEVDIPDAVGLSNIVFLLGDRSYGDLSGDIMVCGSIIGGIGVGCRRYRNNNLINNGAPTWDAASGKLNTGSGSFVFQAYRWVGW